MTLVKDNINLPWSWNLCSLVMEKDLVGLKLQRVLTHTKLPNFRSYKTLFFCCLIFKEIEKRFLDQKFYYLLPRQAWSKGLFNFQNCALQDTKAFYSNGSKVEWSVCWDGFITNNDHQFLQGSLYSKTWKHFYFFIFCTEIYSFLRTSVKIRVIDASKTQVHLFHAYADIKAKFTSFKSAFKNENIHEQKQGDRP